MQTNLPRAIRTLRLQHGWSQEELGRRAGVSRQVISRLERRAVEGMTLATVDRVVDALGAVVRVHVAWRGEQLDRLIDAQHARIVEAVATLLAAAGWIDATEVSFNHYGDRGRVDILAWHPTRRIVLVVEVKTALGDLQETVGRLDVKSRLGLMLAHERGWTDVSAVAAALVIGDTRRARAVVRDHPAYFARFTLRGRHAVAWLRRPSGPGRGLLWFATMPNSHRVTRTERRATWKTLDSHGM